MNVKMSDPRIEEHTASDTELSKDENTDTSREEEVLVAH